MLGCGSQYKILQKPDNSNRRIYPKKPSKKKSAPPQDADGEAGPSTSAPDKRKRKGKSASLNADGEPGPSTIAPGQRKRKTKIASQNVGTQLVLRRSPRKRTVTEVNNLIIIMGAGLVNMQLNGLYIFNAGWITMHFDAGITIPTISTEEITVITTHSTEEISTEKGPTVSGS
ncbi:hypothetical protein CJ030_MR0G005501 [Morella rubra]|uniref:Uncharacterized protein n=1 Tax=Morella rubra TaxID=262757 RepID=A0A6A1UL30_9ROSI|nr:hypothetical protein CJ030_MR0G005501 [Morella rubra]